jgi:hypothetical protein
MDMKIFDHDILANHIWCATSILQITRYELFYDSEFHATDCFRPDGRVLHIPDADEHNRFYTALAMGLLSEYEYNYCRYTGKYPGAPVLADVFVFYTCYTSEYVNQVKVNGSAQAKVMARQYAPVSYETTRTFPRGRTNLV